MDQALPISNPLPLDGGSELKDVLTAANLDWLPAIKPDAALDHVTGRKAQLAEQKGEHLSGREKKSESSMAHFFAGLEKQSSTAGAQNFAIPLDQHYLNNDLIIKGLEAHNFSYNTINGQDIKILANINGLSMTVTAFGKEKQLPVKAISINKEVNGQTSFSLQIENPLPPAAGKIFNASPTIPITFSIDRHGILTHPSDSQILYSMAGQSNTTLPGMVLSDAFKDAGSVAEFIEKNPAWVSNILQPFMSRFGDYLKSNFDASAIVQAPAPKDINHAGHAAMARPTTAPFDAGTFKIKAGGDYHETMTVDGRERKFLVHVPPSYDPTKPMPLVLMVHGMAQKGNDLEALIGSNKLADKEGFVAIYPDAVNWFNVKDLRTWDTGNGLVLPGQHAGDIQFMDNIINTAKKQMNIDPMRVYMAGFSNGGMLAYASAGALSGTLASIAVLSSAMSGHEQKPKEPLSLINVHGTADAIIPIEGITNTPPVLTDVGVPLFQPAHFATDYYKNLDGITAPYTVAHVGNQTIETASNPANGTEVEQITVAGAGHFLTDREKLLQQTWDFFKAHPRTTPPNPKDNQVIEPEIAVENLTTVKQLKNDVIRRGTTGIEQDLDNLFDATRTIADTKIDPSKIFDKITKATHINFNDPVSRFIEDTTLLSKKQDLISIGRKTDAHIPVDVSFGVGSLKSVDVSQVSFNLSKNNGYPQLKNISGITLQAQLAGVNLASRIEDITELPDGPNGVNGRIYRATMQNPLPAWVRASLLSPGQFNVDLKFDANLNPLVVDQNMTERQLLGKNPWINGIADEAQDTVGVTTDFNAMNLLKWSSDVGVTAGLTYVGLRLGGPRAKLIGTLCFLAAPAAIDLIRKEFAS